MADEGVSALLKTQKSLTEWLADIKHKDAAALRREDNEKRERLRVLHNTIGLPFDEPTQFTAIDLSKPSKAFKQFLEDRSDQLCALRLIPTEDDLPKLRIRGETVEKSYTWFLEQEIDPTKYRVDFIPHSAQNNWATIFIVNAQGVQGEIIRGGAHQLTQGFHEGAQPSVFRYDFKTWSIFPQDDEALAYLKETVALLKVSDKKQQQYLAKELDATFVHEYLTGYFETTSSPAFGTWYIDYSKKLGDLYADLTVTTKPSKKAKIAGRTGCQGIATGPVRIVSPDSMGADFPEGAILVCQVTTPAYIPFMERAAGIVTDQGGILSHAAIVARELKKPCLVGTEIATQRLHDGQIVTVNATNGIVSLEG